MDAPTSPPSQLPHIAVFPFMAKGHTVPLLHLTTLIVRRRLATVTFFTTPLNAPFVRSALADDTAPGAVTVLPLAFPVDSVPDILGGAESTDALPSISLLLPFCKATSLLQPAFDRALARSPPTAFLVSDNFLGWTAASAAKLGVPRVVFHAIGAFGMLTFTTVGRNPSPAVDAMQRRLLAYADLVPPFGAEKVDPELREFIVEQGRAAEECHGVLVNSFREMEGEYVDYWNAHPDLGPRAWCVGPLCLAAPPVPSPPTSEWKRWLDSRCESGRPVLYVAFGTHAEVAPGQLREIAAGLAGSGVDFLWAVRAKESEFEDAVGAKGMVVREWVDQMEVLRHGSVEGHLTHCGWNSLTESVCAGVPVVAWPMAADNFVNAELAVEELGIGVRVRARDGTKNGLVHREDIAAAAKELVLGEKGRAAREKARELGEKARKAMADGGSSAETLAKMIREMHHKQQT